VGFDGEEYIQLAENNQYFVPITTETKLFLELRDKKVVTRHSFRVYSKGIIL